MANNTFKWRTQSTSAVYVDGYMGDDVSGDGTSGNPYLTLGKAYRGHTSTPSMIICRGRFCEDMADGNHGCTIRGDYYGAALFDGENTYLIYGFRHNHMIIRNCAIPTADTHVNTNSWSFAGVGSADAANAVNYADYVFGVAGSPAYISRATLYRGCIGGNSAVGYVAVHRPKWQDNVKLWFGGNNSEANTHMTVYDVPAEGRMASPNSNGRPIFSFGLFSKVAFRLNDRVTLNQCLIAADCEFYNGTTKIELSGPTSTWQLQIEEAIAENGVTDTVKIQFNNCVFSNETADEIFNNAITGDLTLRTTSEAVIDDDRYYGAMGPALSVPILDDSSEVAGTWDERTASGLLTVEDNAICMTDTVEIDEGEILSKIVKIDTSKFSVNALYGLFGPKFASDGVAFSNDALTEASYQAGTPLPVGHYLVRGSVTYDGVSYSNNTIVNVTEEGTTFVAVSTGAILDLMNDVNIDNVCYVRSTQAIYARIKATDGLERGGVYLNYGTNNITYRGRTIIPNESFVADNSEDTFACANDADYQIGVMFDDSRVPSGEWLPAQIWGDYFVGKKSGAVQVDSDGKPLSSGNYKAWISVSDGGYTLTKQLLNEKYCQFKFVAKRL